ncbi:MAG: PLP-dependent transferase, partial [Paracoccaceae bacterium]
MKKSLKSRTKMVHAGHRRSQFNEVSEAVYLTQSYVYDSAEQAQERFDGDDEGHFIYARYGNPTVAMFQDRMAALEGAEAAFATASGMAAVSGALLATVKAGDHVVAAR